jgi:hypothetical protein
MSDHRPRSSRFRAAQQDALAKVIDALNRQALAASTYQRAISQVRKALDLAPYANSREPGLRIVAVSGIGKSRIVREYLIRAGYPESEAFTVLPSHDRAADSNPKKTS